MSIKAIFDNDIVRNLKTKFYQINKMIGGKVKLSEIKLHVKAMPLNEFLYEDLFIKRLVFFKEITATTINGLYVLKHNVPSILELDDDYSIKLSDIAGYDGVYENLRIDLMRNDLSFEFSEIWFEFTHTDEEISPKRYFTDSLYEESEDKTYVFYLKFNETQKEHEKHNIKINQLFKYKGIYYLDKEAKPNDYLKDVDYILIDDVEKITDKKLFKPIEEYTGHKVELIYKKNKRTPILYLKDEIEII